MQNSIHLDHQIVCMSKRGPRMSDADIKRKIWNKINQKLSKRTVACSLGETSLHGRISRKNPLFKSKNASCRIIRIMIQISENFLQNNYLNETQVLTSHRPVQISIPLSIYESMSNKLQLNKPSPIATCSMKNVKKLCIPYLLKCAGVSYCQCIFGLVPHYNKIDMNI